MKHVVLTTLMLVALAGVRAAAPAAAPATAPAEKTPPADKKPADNKQAANKQAAKKPADKKPACRVCGGTCHLTPLCVCEPATKKKTKTSYSMKCEPVCVPEPCLSHHGHHGKIGRAHV